MTTSTEDKILVSACLLGHRVRYDAEASTPAGDRLQRWQQAGRLVVVCPEVAGGLSVPRPAAEIRGGDGDDVLDGGARLQTEAGRDVTDAFVAGARHTLEVAQRHGVRFAVLKSKSPSCGTSTIYDGTFSGVRRDGMGVTAALLRRHGIEVFSDRELDELAQRISDPR